MFKSANKPMSGVAVAWEENDPKIAEGKKKFFGERIVGKFIESGRFVKGHTDCATYMLKLYADFNDDSKFGQEPDGEIVTVWGSKLIDDAFGYGGDGSGIQPGDIVEIVYRGRKETANGQNEYHDFAIGSMRPAPTFKPASAEAAMGTTAKPAAKQAAAKPNKALTDLGY